MGRILLFVALIFACLMLIRSLSAGSARRSPRSGKAREAEKVLACRVCGLHVPESEGVATDDGFYCCEDHRLRDSRKA